MGKQLGSNVVRMLIDQSVEMVGKLNSDHFADIAVSLRETLGKVLETLRQVDVTRSQSLLLLSSVRQQISQVERMITHKIIFDDWIPREDMLVLVDVRYGCYRAMNRIQNDMENLRIR
jgi:hypothetical protein